MNRFLRGHRVLVVEKRFCEGEVGGWAFCVEYEVASGRGTEGRPGPKVDYKEVLDEAQFGLFSGLRALRKQLAEEEGVPVYTIFTNEQLAAMVQANARTVADIEKLSGVGKARLEKYAEAFLSVLLEGNPQ